MAGREYVVKGSDLSNLVRLTFDNTTTQDVTDAVLPVYKDRFGGIDGILKSLKVEKEHGISSDEVETRKKVFGINKVEEEPQEPLWKLMWDALQDPTLIFLSCAALFSLFIAIFIERSAYGWLEGVAILFAVFVVVMVGAINDYQKEKQFRELNAKKDDVQITVLREGKTTKVSTFNLVVGDIVLLSTGDIVPADGIILGRNDLEINEKMLTGETVMKKKSPSYEIQGTVKSSPTLFAGTFVQAGEGRMLVVATGKLTYQGTMEEKMKEAEHGRSILQKKLDSMTDLITTVSMYVSIALVLILCARMAYAFHNKKCCMEAWDHRIHWSELLGFVITGITIFVVAVPEGLPLAVTIALAFSVKKMLKDQNLVRHLSACETMGGATTICSDKTGTLTTSRMTVVKMWCGCATFADVPSATRELSPKMSKVVSVSSVVNTLFKTYLKRGEQGRIVYCGNDTECALLILSTQLGHPYENVRKEFPDDHPKRKCFTFSSDRKRMSTIVECEGALCAFTKGAAEIVSALCTSYYTKEGEVKPVDVAVRQAIEKAISDFADEGLRTICISRRVLPSNIDLDDMTAIEKDLALVCLVGIEDPLREEVPGAIRDCKRAGIVVRMVTGDNIQTARAIAKKCGIVSPEDPPESVMDGKTFRERVCDANGNIIQEAFDKVWPALRVLARSTPLDKHVLVSGIQESMALNGVRQTVAVTGDGTNDAPALKKADVGFAMGIQGTEVAKNASDVIIMDDNFVSIVAAVKWGRCVYDNICKFLQFQLTVNITACSLACVGAAILTESPLSAIQMLWVNLIMDSFASLALATEDPNSSLLDRKPYPRDQAVLSQIMVRNMVCHAGWQLMVLTGLIFGLGDVCEGHGDVCTGKVLVDRWGIMRSGRPAFFDTSNLDGACVPLENRSTDYCAKTHGHGEPTQHYTIVFNVFVLLQVFNEINARKIHGEINVFEGMFKHSLFLIIVIGTIIVQVGLIEIPGLNTAFGCTNLTQDQWIACLLLGASAIPINVVINAIPPELFPAGGGGLPPEDEEEAEPAADSKKKRD